MAAYDALPPALRHWLAEAALPWSPDSAKRARRRALRKALWRKQVALRIMDQIEAERLAQDALVVQRQLAGLAPTPLARQRVRQERRS